MILKDLGNTSDRAVCVSPTALLSSFFVIPLFVYGVNSCAVQPAPVPGSIYL